jgi:zinc protease
MKQQQRSFLAVGLLFFLLLRPSTGWAVHTWKRGTLPNGLTLLVVEKPGTPVVSLTLLVKQGTTSEPREKKGVASITARLLTEETHQSSSDQIAKRIAALGREMAVEVSFDDTTINWAVLKEDLTSALDVLADVIQHPVFPHAAVERERKAALAALQAQTQETPEALLLRQVFGTSPYGFSALGETASLKRIEQQDVVRFHRQAYRPTETILAAAGDVTLEQVEGLARKYFGNWTPAEKVEESVPPLSVSKEPAVLVINRPLVQANVRVAFIGAPAADPDTPALLLLSRVLAGSSESRLGRTLREQNGWTYTVWSEIESFRQTGLFFIGMSVPYEVVLPALHETVREISRLQTEPVSAAELEREKQELVTRFYFEAESIQGLSRLAAKQEALTPGQEPDRVLAALRNVTAADVQRVARTYLDPQKAVVTVVGDRHMLGKVAPALAAGKLPQWFPPSGARKQ